MRVACWQSSGNLMVETYYACFRPMLPLFRATNCHFVLDEIISTKNKISKNTVENYMSICLSIYMSAWLCCYRLCNVCYCWKMLRLKKWVRKAFLDTIYSCKLGKGVCPKCQQGRREIPMTLWSTPLPPCWQSADILDRPPTLFATKNSVEKCFMHQFF